ncbi:MAG: carbon-nitrogen hydrolase family protein [Rhodovibrionaceae bacterium]|nr:carbon-nitrogen hydrolase family protein [Rhodovibrionaceae bacterium]
MFRGFTAACVQNTATPDVDHDIRATLEWSRRAAGEGAELVCLPEYFCGLETREGRFLPAAFAEEEHPALPAFAEAARELGLWFHLGSLGITASDGRIFNRGYLIDSTGGIAARYDKIHLFDVNLAEGQTYRESATIAPGGEAVVADTPWAKIGLTICYDLRFAALYRTLAHAGAGVLVVPAAFTRTTGKAHWHVLNRARAIETGSYVLAACQPGEIVGGGACYGHSLIVDPWGRILADGGTEEGYVAARIDMAEVDKARSMIPALTHDRIFSEPGEFEAGEERRLRERF